MEAQSEAQTLKVLNGRALSLRNALGIIEKDGLVDMVSQRSFRFESLKNYLNGFQRRHLS